MRICILGATGLVGRETLELVARAWPDAELDLYASRDQTMKLGDRELEVKAASRLEDANATGGDLALVALDDTHSERYVPRLLDLGYRVVDKSNTYRLDPAVPLVVAGVNDDLLDADARLAANPNCTTIPLTLALAPLARRFGVDEVTTSTYQAVSGAGTGALDDFLAKAKAGYGESDRLGGAFELGGYAGNVVPHAGKTDASGFSSEERKLVNESRKILSQPELAICAQCCRVPVAVGHYINAWVRLGRSADVGAVEEVLGNPTEAPFVRFYAGASGEGLSALAAARDRDRALVGRARRDGRDPEGRTICLTVVADNLRLAAATNAVRMAGRWFPGEDEDLRTPPRG